MRLWKRGQTFHGDRFVDYISLDPGEGVQPNVQFWLAQGIYE